MSEDEKKSKKKLNVKRESRVTAECAHDISLMVDLLAGEITEEAQPKLSAQLDSCEICRNKLEELSRTWSLTREVLNEEIHPENVSTLDNTDKSDQDNNKIVSKNNSSDENDAKLAEIGRKPTKNPKKIKFAWLEIAASVIFLLFVVGALLPALSKNLESARKTACSNKNDISLMQVPSDTPSAVEIDVKELDRIPEPPNSDDDDSADDESTEGASVNPQKVLDRRQDEPPSDSVDVEMPDVLEVKPTNSALLIPQTAKPEKKRMKRYAARVRSSRFKVRKMKPNLKGNISRPAVSARKQYAPRNGLFNAKKIEEELRLADLNRGNGHLVKEKSLSQTAQSSQEQVSIANSPVSAKLEKEKALQTKTLNANLKLWDINTRQGLLDFLKKYKIKLFGGSFKISGNSVTFKLRAQDMLKVERLFFKLNQAEERMQEDRNGLPFIKTNLKPFSTFSIDVDTASYTRSAKIIRAGSRPSPSSVRAEEFINYFDYHYRSPSRGDTFGVDLEAAPSLFRPRNILFRIGVLAKRLGAAESKRPSAFTVLIDTSGSMASKNRLELVKYSIPLLLAQMKPRDLISVVACGSSVRLIVPSTTARNSRRVVAAVAKLAPAGVTDLEQGLRYAYAVAEKNYLAGASNRLVLFTDGVSNISGATAEEILAKVANARKMGVANTIVSVGGDGDDAFLEALADKGDGNYVFIQHEEDATELFEQQFSARFREVARDVKIQVEFNPALVAGYRQIGYGNRQLSKADFRNDKVDAGEVGAGQSVTALYELKLRHRPIPMQSGHGDEIVVERERPLATVRIRYRRSDTMRVEEREFPLIAANIAKNPNSTTSPFRLSEIAAEFAESLKYANVSGIANTGTIRKKLRPILAGTYANDSKVRNLDTLLRLCR